MKWILLLALLIPQAFAHERAKTKEIVMGLAAEPRTLLPNMILDWTTQMQLGHIYDAFLDRDPKTFKPVPALATSWKVINELTWEFELRKGVKFHNGELFDGEAVKATIDFLRDPKNKSQYLGRVELIQEVKILSPHKVRILTSAPYPGIVYFLAGRQFLVFPPKVLREKGAEALTKEPIGTGPYKFGKLVPGERLVLEHNPEYWKGAPAFKKVTFRFIPEFSSRLAALLAGEIDVMKDTPPQAVELVEKSKVASVRTAESFRINYLALVNAKPGPIQDVRVRRALLHAVNVDELIAKVLQGRATRACGHVAKQNEIYATPRCTQYDPARAKALLKEMGIEPSDLKLTLNSPSGRYPMDKEVSLAVAAQLEKIGVKVNVVVNEWGTHLDKVKTKNAGDMVLLGWGGTVEGERTLNDLFKSDQPFVLYDGGKDMDEKIARAQTIMDRKARHKLTGEVQCKLQENVPWVPLWQQHDLYSVANWVEWNPRSDEKVWFYDAKIKN